MLLLKLWGFFWHQMVTFGDSVKKHKASREEVWHAAKTTIMKTLEYPMEAISLKLDDGFLSDIEKTMKQHRYTTKTEFIREAIRDKIKQAQKSNKRYAKKRPK